MKTVARSLALLLLFSAYWAHAQNSLSVTVTPPLFQLTIGPGETWTSALKIVNSNSYDVSYYAEVVDFVAEGESGQGSFVPLIRPRPGDATSTNTLASWIEIPTAPTRVSEGASGEVPFTVRIPLDAAPGGHYAAILVGTEPGAAQGEGPSMRVSSLVSSLLFVRIKGEVVESGRIREFRTVNELYETPKADFILRFENTGNTHLRPQGDVTIYNMWGKERGKVFINHKSEFGNVLPESTRKYEFSWEGGDSLFDIGRYRAEVTLTFGQDEKQNATYATSFWVVPIVPVLITMSCIIIFILLILWLVRRYVRRALALEKARYGVIPEQRAAPRISALMEPLKEGVVDLRSAVRARRMIARTPPGTPPNTLSFVGFLRKYGTFFLFVALVVAGGFSIWNYFDNVLTSSRQFQVTDVKVQEEE